MAGSASFLFSSSSKSSLYDHMTLPLGIIETVLHSPHSLGFSGIVRGKKGKFMLKAHVVQVTTLSTHSAMAQYQHHHLEMTAIWSIQQSHPLASAHWTGGEEHPALIHTSTLWQKHYPHFSGKETGSEQNVLSHTANGGWDMTSWFQQYHLNQPLFDQTKSHLYSQCLRKLQVEFWT